MSHMCSMDNMAETLQPIHIQQKPQLSILSREAPDIQFRFARYPAVFAIRFRRQATG